ncbi:MAG: pantetheine-phosphate adenylyltransferase [Planctomycetota bacterium]
MEPHALFPGSFDPPTLGHLDLIRRAARLFGRVTVGVADHASKNALLTVDERLQLIEACTADLDGVRAIRVGGLVVNACEELGATAMVRGVRNGTDLDYESEMARTNRALLTRIDTVLLVPAPEVSHVSSTLVRQIARLGGDVTSLVPEPVAAFLRERFGS